MVTPAFRPKERLVRTSDLIREYLNGAYEFPEDEAQDVAARPSDGDYISRMHRRVKAQFRSIAPEEPPGVSRAIPEPPREI